MALSNIATPKPLAQEKLTAVMPGTRTDLTGKAVRNVILLSIPDDEYELLRPNLELVSLPHHYVMHERGEKLDFGYFLNEGMASLVVRSKDERSVEVGVVGKEGMLGTSLAVGMNRGPYQAIMQIPGSGLRIHASVLETILPATPNLQQRLSRYILTQGLQLAQVAACNRLHELEQRMSRWLLMCQDRVDSEILTLTHDFLAQMLGSGRPSVTLACGILERTGAIENLRGTIKVLNRKALEDAACECYDVIQHFNGGLGLK